MSLLKVCSIMIEEEGNPKMKQFGRDLEQGRWCCTRVGEHRFHTDLTLSSVFELNGEFVFDMDGCEGYM